MLPDVDVIQLFDVAPKNDEKFFGNIACLANGLPLEVKFRL